MLTLARSVLVTVAEWQPKKKDLGPRVGNDEFNSENPTSAPLIVPVVTSTPLQPLHYHRDARTFYITLNTPSTTHTFNPKKEKEKETKEKNKTKTRRIEEGK